jgi:hypothetical protein
VRPHERHTFQPPTVKIFSGTYLGLLCSPALRGSGPPDVDNRPEDLTHNPNERSYKLMERSHMPSSRARGSMRAPLGAQPDTQMPADDAAALPRTSEGPVPPWAPEALPSGPSPTAHIPQEPQGSPPSPRSFRPVRWSDPADARAWLGAARASVADLAALAREGSRRGRHRVLSRAELRRQARDLERALLALFDRADAGLAGPLAVTGSER